MGSSQHPNNKSSNTMMNFQNSKTILLGVVALSATAESFRNPGKVKLDDIIYLPYSGISTITKKKITTPKRMQGYFLVTTHSLPALRPGWTEGSSLSARPLYTGPRGQTTYARSVAYEGLNLKQTDEIVLHPITMHGALRSTCPSKWHDATSERSLVWSSGVVVSAGVPCYDCSFSSPWGHWCGGHSDIFQLTVQELAGYPGSNQSQLHPVKMGKFTNNCTCSGR